MFTRRNLPKPCLCAGHTVICRYIVHSLRKKKGAQLPLFDRRLGWYGLITYAAPLYIPAYIYRRPELLHSTSPTISSVLNEAED